MTKFYSILHRTRLCGHIDADSVVGKIFATPMDAMDHVEKVARGIYDDERLGSRLTSWRLVFEGNREVTVSDDDSLEQEMYSRVEEEMFLMFGEGDMYDQEVLESWEIYEVEL